MSPSGRQRRADLAVSAALACGGASVVLFFLLVAAIAVPESSVPILTALAGFFGALAAFFMALSEWFERREGGL